MTGFEGVFVTTACPFARWANYITCKVVTKDDFISAVTCVRKFSREPDRHKTDAVLVELVPEFYGSALAGLAEVLHTLLLCSIDLQPERIYADIQSQNWRLSLNGADFFVVVLAPEYKPSHPRFTHGNAFVLLQPEALFSELRITSGRRRKSYSSRAQRSFYRAKQSYFAHHSLGTPKAYRFLLDHEGAGIPWWESLVRADLREPLESS
ncbi:YqcI/YcgG family protein [Bradyrhizobium yuanmingense]|uniref:YqcI/YcgG family protein n=1 Tax=Bradyrhizobium yuanmingense TaxID=108015 RepID=A0A1C3XM56_9BRAD|nr:YqcI/YcgG family protein [Bradyrhizobium yuanmingense]MCA1530593.1 YqcI/YcgG family protein [Bradyrhizobium yuanmingense]TWI16734.1 YqcI/YcgG family protein [Bradyrhizobium yuanmingense]SCB53136.1 YqcI/YcgG family protein [Bradyrhizobium yuanmingense]